jgi:ankyrin repeat protein
LMMAAIYASPDAVKLLLESGADWNLKNEQDLTSLQFAMKAKKQETVEVISAFIRAQNKSGGW